MTIESFTDRHGNDWTRHPDGSYHSPECYVGCADGIELDDVYVSWLGPFENVVYGD